MERDLSKIKLVYFDFNFWRIDILRLCLSYANIEYEFERIPRNEWLNFKDKQPFGQLPVMYYNDNIFCHTHSLAIFCASKSNLYSNKEKRTDDYQSGYRLGKRNYLQNSSLN